VGLREVKVTRVWGTIVVNYQPVQPALSYALSLVAFALVIRPRYAYLHLLCLALIYGLARISAPRR
jgi:hypothetical protein